MDQKSLIIRVQEAIKEGVSEQNYNNWFRLVHWQFNGQDKVSLQVPNRFVRDWIRENYLERIQFEFFKLTGRQHQVDFRVQSATKPNKKTSKETTQEKSPNQATQKIARGLDRVSLTQMGRLLKPQIKQPYSLNRFNPAYTFERYVVGGANQFVSAACQAVAQNPGQSYNPLLIYGGVGLGKTHLLHAIGLHVGRTRPNLRVIYTTGEAFTNEVINSIRFDKTTDFRRRYRENCDLLLIDDIQFIAGKERTMEEFFHTFNAIHQAKGQIVLTTDTLPQKISQLEERLRSRFSWGLVADIQPPDFETRCAILYKKAELEKIRLPETVCRYVATYVHSNVRDLEGCLTRLKAFASLAGVDLTLQLAKEILGQMLNEVKPKLSMNQIQQIVAEKYSIKRSELCSQNRQKRFAKPRQIAMYLCKKYIKSSYPEIAREFDKKDHTTVLHACQKVTQNLNKDPHLKNEIEELDVLLEAKA